jgi:pimeloyl-ACP methyl ester carboxylesterase
MNTQKLFQETKTSSILIVFLICQIVFIGAMALAWYVQTDFGKLSVANVVYENYNGIPVRAKLLKPVYARDEFPLPGIVSIHGYQNNRETSDAYAIELARRDFVVLSIDAIGRGNSGIPNDINEYDFDPSYGGTTSLKYLKSLPFVDPEAVGLMGHSLGAEMVYNIALQDPSVKALVISGFAYTDEASGNNPQNMLMIYGKYDEYRQRMTGTTDFEAQWMSSPQTKNAFAESNPEFGVTYGDFSAGTARRVFMPRVVHLQEAHNHEGIAEAAVWMRNSLTPTRSYWLNEHAQIWQVKEWATLIAMLSCFASLIPLGLLLLRIKFFKSLQGPIKGKYAGTGKSYLKYALINMLLMWLYLPLIFVLFGLHIFVIPIDKAFPMMMVNGVVWWFLLVNLIGFFLFLRWYKKHTEEEDLSLEELGLSYSRDRFRLEWPQIGKTALLAALLFAFAYLSEHILEQIFIVDFRFIFPFASDLTIYRAEMFLRYFPFLLVGFLLLGVFLHALMRRPQKKGWLGTFLSWSLMNMVVMIVPLVLFLLIQYVPLLTVGVIPFVGPGGMLASFTMNIFHLIVVLALVIPISTWFYQLTGKIYLGAFLNAALVTWMFVSSQVIAPIPV